MMWQALALVFVAAAAGASLAWSWRLAVQLDARERDLHRLREAVSRAERTPATAASTPPPAAAPEPVESWLDELDRRRPTFATLIAARVVPARAHRGAEPFVLVVDVVLSNRGERDVRLSLRTRENDHPLTVRRYLGQADKLYSAPQPVPVGGGVVDAERGQRPQLIRADDAERLDFVVPLHEAGLYRLAFRVRGDEVTGDEAKTGGAVVWSAQRHVVVG